MTTEELLEDVCDAYRFVDEQLWSRLGVTSERAGREMKGRIIVAGASARKSEFSFGVLSFLEVC